MRRLAVDAGMSRIGLAISEGSLCLALDAIKNSAESAATIAQTAASRGVTCIYIGLPKSLSGSLTASSLMAIDLAKRVEASTTIPVRMIDERMTTKSAASMLRETGKNSKSSKGLIDSQSAVVILEFALSSEIANSPAGKPLGELLD